MKKLMCLFVFLLPVVAFAQSEEELRDKIAREVPKYAPSQQQLAEKAKVIIQVVRVKKRDGFKSDFLLKEYQIMDTMECEGVVLGIRDDKVEIALQKECKDENAYWVQFPNFKNSSKNFCAEGHYYSLIFSKHVGNFRLISVPLTDFAPEVQTELNNTFTSHRICECQVARVLKNAPSPNVEENVSKKVPGKKSFGQNFMDYFFSGK